MKRWNSRLIPPVVPVKRRIEYLQREAVGGPLAKKLIPHLISEVPEHAVIIHVHIVLKLAKGYVKVRQACSI